MGVITTEPKAVVFDLDDTLILERDRAFESFRVAAGQGRVDDVDSLAEQAVAVAGELWRGSPHLGMGQELGIASWEAMWATFEGGHSRLDEVRDWAPAFRLSVWERALASVGGNPMDAPALVEAFIEAQQRPHPLLPGGMELVEALARAGRRVALLTNGPPDIQRHKLGQLPCADHFSAVVISGEAGIGKPDPAVFRLVLEGLNASPDDAVMVGDSWNRDIQGAAGVGMRSIWLSSGREVPGTAGEVSVVESIAAAAGVLGC